MIERYQKGSEVLGSKDSPVRLGGIDALARLAHEHPGDYHTQIMRLLSVFVRPPAGKAGETPLPINGFTADAEFNNGQDKADDS